MSEGQYSQGVTWAGWLIEIGQYERAMQILAHLLASYPDNVNITYRVMVLAHNSVDRSGGAETTAHKVLAVQSNDPNAHRLLVEALIAQDRDPEARLSLRAALRLAPEDDALPFLISIALARMGHTREALFYAREVVKPSPGSVDNRMILTVAQTETSPQAAETALQETLALDPMFGDILLLRSWMLDEHGNHHDTARALAAYTTQTSDYERSHLMVDIFSMKLISSARLRPWGATIPTLLFLPFARPMNLPGNPLLLPLILVAVPTYQPTNSCIRAFQRAFTSRNGRTLHSFIRTHRFLSLRFAVTVVLWLGLILGTICVIRRANTILFGVAGANLGHLALGWVVLRIIPFIRGRNT